jgi:catechol 2,3-dioxygenase-like lactoylglutathione lyase family enzyme
MEVFQVITARLTGCLLVNNYDEALEFYVGKLGFEILEDATMGPERWVTVRRPGSEDFVLALHQAQTQDDLNLVGKQGGSFPLFGLYTDDCVTEYRRLMALGVTFHGEPEAQPYGTGVLLEDLYGNQIFLNEEPR